MNFVSKGLRHAVLAVPVAFVSVACCSIGAPSQANELQEGVELGAQITITSTSPVNATVQLKPTLPFASVIVELPNEIAGPHTACSFGRLVAGQQYTCEISGRVADDDSGLVISIIGLREAGRLDLGNVSRKLFTVPNPQFNAAATREEAKAATEKEPVTLKSKPLKPQ